MKSALFLATIAMSAIVHAADDVSAFRPLDVDYTVYEQKIQNDNDDEKMMATAHGSAQLYSEKAALPKPTSWRSIEDMKARFKEIRDGKFLEDDGKPRRITWLYPQDGCYARAALVNREIFRKFIPIPKKVFAFGNLRVKTKNAKRGVVGWWYHVAPIVEVGGTKFVLDPAIEPKKPLTLHDWLARMGTPSKIKVSICNTGTYTPGSNCSSETDGVELRAERSIDRFLRLEKENLKSMKRPIENELGEAPPWTNENDH